MPTHARPLSTPSSTAALARDVTRGASAQTYHIIRWLADRDLTDDAYRAYAYFRWVDDTIDVASKDRRTQLAFVARQRRLLQRLQSGDPPNGLTPQECLLADLLSTRREDHPGLVSYMANMMAVMAFDAARRGRLITAEELEHYTLLLSTAVTDGLAYFIGHGRIYPAGSARLLAVQGAHVAHMLRDTHVDLEAGYFNVPRQLLEAHHLAPTDIAHPVYRSWVRERVDLALRCMREGKRYIRSTGNARAQLVWYLYCARFEVVLRCIELDHYSLRSEYTGRPGLAAWLLTMIEGHRLAMRSSKRTSAGGPH